MTEREGQVVFTLNSELFLPEDAPVRLTSAQLEELDYRKLYAAYSSRGRKSVTDPRVLFKLLVYGYQCGIYTTRKLEEACRYRIDFRWLLWDEPVPDHSTISRFRTGRCAEAVEDVEPGNMWIICPLSPVISSFQVLIRGPLQNCYFATAPSHQCSAAPGRAGSVLRYCHLPEGSLFAPYRLSKEKRISRSSSVR